MDNNFKSIENYLDSQHSVKSQDIIININNSTKDNNIVNNNLHREPLEITILKQRMESVNVIKYYKDLKNQRLKTEISETLNSVEEMSDFISNNMDKKPWPRMDKFTKCKKITKFVDKLYEKGKISLIDKKQVELNLKKLLDDKKITKKNLEMDEDNNIIKLDTYSLL